MEIQIFDKNDRVYLDFIAKNPNSLVVNTRRKNHNDYFILHKSTCRHIRNEESHEKGAFTERKYIKICSNSIKDLKNWFNNNDELFTGDFHYCGSCNP